MYYYLGYYEKCDKYTHFRIIAQGNKADKEQLKEVQYACDLYYSKRFYHLIQAPNKSTAMQTLSNIAKD